MKLELNPDYIKLLMKEIISKSHHVYAPSIKRKAQMVLDHISQAEKDKLRALEELEDDMDIFREAADVEGEMRCINRVK